MKHADSTYDVICLPLGASALGGAERSLLDVAAGFAARGASVLVLAEEPLRGTAFLGMAAERGVHVKWVPWRPERSRIRNAIDAWRVFRRHRAPFLYFTVGWRRGMWVLPLVARLAMRTRMIGSMRTMPDPHQRVRKKRYFGFLPGLGLWHIPEVIVGWLWGQLLDLTVSVNRLDFPARLVAHYGFSRAKIRVILNGIATREVRLSPEERRAIRGRHGWADEDLLIGFVGRLSPEKGAQYLLDALTPLPEPIRIVMIGDGPQRAELEALAAERDIAHRVAFLGNVDRPGDLIACFDVVAVPTVVEEAFGRVVVESLNEGVPIIATQVGGMAELFTDGIEGYYVPPRDPQAIAAAVSKLAMTMDRGRAMGEAGRRLVREKYSLARTVEEYCRLYDELVPVGSRGRAPRPERP